MLRPVHPILVVAASLLAASCGPAFESGSPGTGGEGGAQGPSGSTSGPGGGEGGDQSSAASGGSGGGVTPSGSTAGSGGAGGSSGCAQLEDETFIAQADTHITSVDDCNSTENGSSQTVFVGPQGGIERVGLFRFEISPGAALAIASETVDTLRFQASVVDCGGQCPPTGGTLQIRRLRNEWIEQVEGPIGDLSGLGANWCRRGGIELWEKTGAQGASDSGAEAGSVVVDATDASFAMELELAKLDNWVRKISDKYYVSLRLSGGGATLIGLASRDTMNDITARPRLRVKYCLASQ